MLVKLSALEPASPGRCLGRYLEMLCYVDNVLSHFSLTRFKPEQLQQSLTLMMISGYR